jgi:hypothetical protein
VCSHEAARQGGFFAHTNTSVTLWNLLVFFDGEQILIAERAGRIKWSCKSGGFMRTILLFSSAAALVFAVNGQGTIKLENNNTIKTDGSGTYKIPFWVDLNADGIRQHVAGSTTDEIGIGQYAALNGKGTASLGFFTASNQTVPFATAIFRTDSNGDFLGTPSTQTVVVPGAAAGTFPSLTAAIWFGATLANGVAGSLNSWTWTVTRPLGGDPGGGATPILPSGLAGLGNEATNAGLNAFAPEPSTVALGAFGIAVLLLRRGSKDRPT